MTYYTDVSNHKANQAIEHTRSQKGDMELMLNQYQLSAKQCQFLLLTNSYDRFNKQICQRLASEININKLYQYGLLELPFQGSAKTTKGQPTSVAIDYCAMAKDITLENLPSVACVA